jgi:tRNA nucleotidyltransferase (CCA-adding enzyme)
MLAQASSSTISGIIQRLQLSTVQARALEWAGEKTSRIAETLSGDAPLRPSQIYRMLSRLPGEAVVFVLAKGLLISRAADRGRLTRRLARFLTRDRLVTTTINGETLKRFGLSPGPHFREILDRVLEERLDGRITAAAEERELARLLAERYA